MPARPGRDPDPVSDVQLMRMLAHAVDHTRFIGIGIILVGVAAILLNVWDPPVRWPRYVVVGAASTALVAPGLLFVVASVFLARRRYWAWAATNVLSWVALVAAVGLCGAAAYDVIRVGEYGELFGPAVALGCWGTALGSILWALRVSLPAVRQMEQLARPAFNVIPGRRDEPGQ